MDYGDSLHALVHAGAEAATPIPVETPPPGETFFRQVFGAQMSSAIAAAGYPGEIEIRWSAENLYLYSLDTLEDRQAGYRDDAKTGAKSAACEHSRYVLADWAANPVCIGADGTICDARRTARAASKRNRVRGSRRRAEKTSCWATGRPTARSNRRVGPRHYGKNPPAASCPPVRSLLAFYIVHGKRLRAACLATTRSLSDICFPRRPSRGVPSHRRASVQDDRRP